MDLALDLGAGSVHQMLSSMPVNEVADWQKYAAKRLLPGRRMELYLAQIAQMHGGGKLDDYLLRVEGEESESEPQAQIAAATVIGKGSVHVLTVERHPMQDQLDKFDREEAAKQKGAR